MKSIALLFVFAAAAFAAPKPKPAQVHKVYLLPMAHGLDQYLANRLTGSGSFEVVAEPAAAEALFTDHLGDAFQTRLEELFPKPQPPAKGEAKSGESAEKKRDEMAGMEHPPLSAFARSKGTIFLVDVKTRAVIWSVYDRAQTSHPDQLDRAATRIVTRLKHDFKQK